MLSILIPNKLEENVYDFVEEIEKTLPVAQVIVATDREGKGKGWALREALKESTGEWIVFLDADRDIEPRMLKRLIPFLEDYDIVVASKKIYKASWDRKVITYLSRLYIRLVFGIGVDTQTGLKLFKREALGEWKTDGYAFDIEILRNAKRRGLTMIEVPIEVNIKAKMSTGAIWKTFIETVKILISQ